MGHLTGLPLFHSGFISWPIFLSFKHSMPLYQPDQPVNVLHGAINININNGACASCLDFKGSHHKNWIITITSDIIFSLLPYNPCLMFPI